MGYSKDGPCLKFTSLFFKDKKFMLSFEKDFGRKSKIEKNKTRYIK